MKDIDSSIVAFEKSIKLYPNNDLEKVHPRNYLYQISRLDFGLNYFLSYHSEIVIMIDKITNNFYDKSLLFIRCKLNIELKKYRYAELDLNRLFELNHDFSFVYTLQNYTIFWQYLCKIHGFYDYNYQLENTNDFNFYMYKGKYI